MYLSCDLQSSLHLALATLAIVALLLDHCVKTNFIYLLKLMVFY